MSNNPKNLRKCVVCREHADKSELIRFVKQNGEVRIDTENKLSGRGAYVHKSKECVEKLIKRRALNAAFRCSVDQSVYDGIKSE